MTSDSDLVELTTAKTAIEAEWLVGALKGLGIHAVTFGDKLADEFAMSQRLMGLGGGVRVMVPRGELDRARVALVAIEEERPAPEDLEAALAPIGAVVEQSDSETTAEDDTADDGRTMIIGILSLAVIALGWLSISQHRRLAVLEPHSPISSSQWAGDRWEVRWRDNDQLASEAMDRNRNGVFEASWVYDRRGRLLAKYVDANENEVYELAIDLRPDATEIGRLIDADESGIPERYERAPDGGVQELWIDANEDRTYERWEFVKVGDGEVLDAFEYRGREGYVRVK